MKLLSRITFEQVKLALLILYYGAAIGCLLIAVACGVRGHYSEGAFYAVFGVSGAWRRS